MDSIPIPRDIALGLVSDPERYLPVVKEIISRASHPESTQAGLSPELAQPHDDVLQNQLRSHNPTLGPESMSFSSTTNSNKRSTSRATKKEAEHNDGGSPPFFLSAMLLIRTYPVHLLLTPCVFRRRRGGD